MKYFILKDGIFIAITKEEYFNEISFQIKFYGRSYVLLEDKADPVPYRVILEAQKVLVHEQSNKD